MEKIVEYVCQVCFYPRHYDCSVPSVPLTACWQFLITFMHVLTAEDWEQS